MHTLSMMGDLRDKVNGKHAFNFSLKTKQVEIIKLTMEGKDVIGVLQNTIKWLSHISGFVI